MGFNHDLVMSRDLNMILQSNIVIEPVTNEYGWVKKTDHKALWP